MFYVQFSDEELEVHTGMVSNCADVAQHYIESTLIPPGHTAGLGPRSQ